MTTLATLTPENIDTDTTWCGHPIAALDGNACPNSPDCCADCCPCHGDGVSRVTFNGLSVSLVLIALTATEGTDDGAQITARRVGDALREHFGRPFSDSTARVVLDAICTQVGDRRTPPAHVDTGQRYVDGLFVTSCSCGQVFTGPDPSTADASWCRHADGEA